MMRPAQRGARLTLPRFPRVSQSILRENALTLQFDGGTNFSFPVLLRREGMLLDAMFLYGGGEFDSAAPRPHTWILLKSGAGSPQLLANCLLADFMPQGAYPMSATVDLRMPARTDPKLFAQNCKHLFDFYEQLRAFAFEQAPTERQRETMAAYRGLFAQLVPPGLYPYYKGLSPAFFDWLGLLSDVAVAGAQPAPQTGTRAEPEQTGVDGLRAQLAALAQLFEEKIASDAHKNKLFDDLHTELAEYKKGVLGALTEPIERDIIKLIDDIGRTLEAYRGKNPTRENYIRFFSLFEGVRTDLGDLLYRQGLEPFSVEGGKVDILRQQILTTVPTSDPKLDKTVAKRHAGGWEKNGKVLRPERISVYVYTPAD